MALARQSGWRDEPAVAQAPERFHLADLMQFWNPEWRLERAGFGPLDRGTWLEGDVLSTHPRDEARGVALVWKGKLGPQPRLEMEVSGRGWNLHVLVNNTTLASRPVDGPWQALAFDLAAFGEQEVEIRLIQRSGPAYWRSLRLR